MPTPVEEGTARQVIPDEIQVIFGKPPLLYNENPAHYMRLLSKIALTIDPKDTIEWFWVKDVADLLWEIQRVRRFKATMINYGRKAGLAQLLAIAVDDGEYAPGSAYDRGVELAHQFIAGNTKRKTKPPYCSRRTALTKSRSWPGHSIIISRRSRSPTGCSRLPRFAATRRCAKSNSAARPSAGACAKSWRRKAIRRFGFRVLRSETINKYSTSCRPHLRRRWHDFGSQALFQPSQCGSKHRAA